MAQLFKTSHSNIGKAAIVGLCLLGLSACETMPPAASQSTNQVTSDSSTISNPASSSTNHDAISESVPSFEKPASESPMAGLVIEESPAATRPSAFDTQPTLRQPVPVYNLPADNPSTSQATNAHRNPLTIDEPLTNPSPNVISTTPNRNPSVSAPVKSSNNSPTVPSIIITTPNPANEPAKSAREALLERARQNSQPNFETKPAPVSDGDNLPAFRNLMQQGINALKAGKLTEAESSFTRAQRLAPRSSAVYFYLGQVAIKKGQPRKAEAMARRGLVVAQDTSRKRALWQLILQSGQMQNNAKVVNEASQALRRL
ncbi:MAG: tetratricopeptide repeat protein [Psychrobacter sp.]|nr:tetratricopeptide repeat protein [Psychrobacter sp.]